MDKKFINEKYKNFINEKIKNINKKLAINKKKN